MNMYISKTSDMFTNIRFIFRGHKTWR